MVVMDSDINPMDFIGMDIKQIADFLKQEIIPRYNYRTTIDWDCDAYFFAKLIAKEIKNNQKG